MTNSSRKGGHVNPNLKEKIQVPSLKKKAVHPSLVKKVPACSSQPRSRCAYATTSTGYEMTGA
jgi:hypothetical protein